MRPFLTLHHPAQARRYRQQGLWRDDTFYGLLARHAAATPHAIALEDGERRLTWQALRHWVDGVAAELRTYGLVGGDRVAIWMANRVEAIVTSSPVRARDTPATRRSTGPTPTLRSPVCSNGCPPRR